LLRRRNEAHLAALGSAAPAGAALGSADSAATAAGAAASAALGHGERGHYARRRRRTGSEETNIFFRRTVE